MNILFVAPYPPVLHRHGGGVRMYHNIRLLSEKHTVHVLSFVGSDEENDLLASVRPICESIQGIRRVPDFRPHWLSIKPFLVREFSTPAMYQAIDRLLRAKKFDVLQCEYLQTAHYRRRNIFSVLTAHEASSKNAWEAFTTEPDPTVKLQLFYRWMQVLNYEVNQVRKFDRVVTMTSEDAAFLKSYAPEARVRPIPIGIDAEEFKPADPDPYRPISVLFMGNFFHLPNVEAARFLSTELAPRFPDVRFTIAGSPLLGEPTVGANVELLGHVPDTRTLYHRPNTIVVAPLFSGTGQRVKLLEAFSMACPVVTTRIGAMGFPSETGVNMFLAETANEYEVALRRLIAEPLLRRRVGDNARAMILDRFTWSRIGRDYLDVVEEASVSH
jgi:glycosyltransferase involved in cell wall biosynthesis